MRFKGVTPVIAVILLLLILIVMVGGVFAWLNIVQEDIEEATREQITRFIDDIQREVYIVTYSCDDPVGTGSVHAHNGWDKPINTTIYLNGQSRGIVTLDVGEDIELVNLDGSNLQESDIEDGNRLQLSAEGRVVAGEVFRC